MPHIRFFSAQNDKFLFYFIFKRGLRKGNDKKLILKRIVSKKDISFSMQLCILARIYFYTHYVYNGTVCLDTKDSICKTKFGKAFAF